MVNKEEYILNNNPFEKITGRLVSVENIKHEFATTGNVYRAVSSKGKIFKFSFYNDLKTAIRVDANVRKCPALLPKYHGRFKTILLFDWIEGELLTNLLNDNNIYKLGILYGELHRLNDTIGNSSSKKKIRKTLAKFKLTVKNNPNYISNSVALKIELKFNNLIKHLDQDIILEMNDCNPANIMVNKHEELVIVDEEAINHNIKGRGFAGYLKHFNKKQKKLFWKGYLEKHPNDYFTKDYEEALKIYVMVRSFMYRINKYGLDHKKTKMIRLELMKLV